MPRVAVRRDRVDVARAGLRVALAGGAEDHVRAGEAGLAEGPAGRLGDQLGDGLRAGRDARRSTRPRRSRRWAAGRRRAAGRVRCSTTTATRARSRRGSRRRRSRPAAGSCRPRARRGPRTGRPASRAARRSCSPGPPTQATSDAVGRVGRGVGAAPRASRSRCRPTARANALAGAALEEARHRGGAERAGRRVRVERVVLDELAAGRQARLALDRDAAPAPASASRQLSTPPDSE